MQPVLIPSPKPATGALALETYQLTKIVAMMIVIMIIITIIITIIIILMP